MAKSLNHLFIQNRVQSVEYRSVMGGGRTLVGQRRDRQTHSQRLLAQLAALTREENRIAQLRAASNVPTDAGITVAIEVEPKGILEFASIEWARDKIQVLSVVELERSQVVSVHVPRGKLSAFEKRVREYSTKDKKPKKDGSTGPVNEDLVNAISAFRLAVFDELWTDSIAAPSEDELAWYQVWLRITSAGAAGTREAFVQRCASLAILVDPGWVSFPGRTVIAVQGTRRALQGALELLDLVAEIRSVRPSAEFFLAELKPYEQAEWVSDLHARVQYALPESNSFVTLLDTGVNRSHPLISTSLDEADVHSLNANWSAADHHGHGTGMAGLALHGDLTLPLMGLDDREIGHRLESVRIRPPEGSAHAPRLYGRVMSQAVEIVEAVNVARQRTFAMMTTSEGETSGIPSEWSAQVDRLSFGIKPTDDGLALAPDRNPKLFVLAGGNIRDWNLWEHYPNANLTYNVENPGQSWNALTVGAFTDLDGFDSKKWPSLAPIAASGGLSPASRTSASWLAQWPFKPDVVAEGGNACRDTARGGVTIGPLDLRVLTTSHEPSISLLAETGDTSAATAEVARICGHLCARYPDYWPETLRGLVVHGARWTGSMLNGATAQSVGPVKRALVRTYGYGAVDLERSMVSQYNDATLVLQETIVPYVVKEGDIKLGKMNLHMLPWPAEKLLDLDSRDVELRITLSYFIEPNPAQRGWQSKFRYQSHGLRFAVKAASEDLTRFQQRINKLERDASIADNAETTTTKEKESMPDPEASKWFLGAKMRGQGSIHSDVWSGNARALAEMDHIAVYPVGGWWKNWKGGGRQDTATRYALVVSLRVVGDARADIYTPIANEIGIMVPPIAV